MLIIVVNPTLLDYLLLLLFQVPFHFKIVYTLIFFVPYYFLFLFLRFFAILIIIKTYKL
jgi:hypothetical protein